jgi:hypothetical protein
MANTGCNFLYAVYVSDEKILLSRNWDKRAYTGSISCTRYSPNKMDRNIPLTVFIECLKQGCKVAVIGESFGQGTIEWLDHLLDAKEIDQLLSVLSVFLESHTTDQMIESLEACHRSIYNKRWEYQKSTLHWIDPQEIITAFKAGRKIFYSGRAFGGLNIERREYQILQVYEDLTAKICRNGSPSSSDDYTYIPLESIQPHQIRVIAD